MAMETFIDSFVDQRLEELQDDPRELRRYKDFSVYADLLPFIPTNIKAYIQSQLGIDKPFTELDLTDKEIAALDKIIFEQGLVDPSKINYPDYKTKSDYGDVRRNVVGMVAKNYGVTEEEVINNKGNYFVNDPTSDQVISLEDLEKKYPGILNTESMGIKDLINPAFSMKTFIGKGDIIRDNDGNVIIEDTYNFGNPTLNKIEREQLEGVGLGSNPMYEMARRMPIYNPLNVEFPVELNMGTEAEYRDRIK